jgi:hypothetical protein
MDLRKKVEDVFEVTAEPAVDVVSSMFLDGIAGSIVPGVASAMLAYKQKRSERMIESFMLETKKRQDEFEKKLLDLDETTVAEITSKYFGLIMDYVIDNRQEEKIEYIVNGFINLTTMEKLQEDVVIIFYDLLSELNMLDLRVLKLYDYFTRCETFADILESAKITYDQYNLIRNKLERLGLIEGAAEPKYDEMFENVRNMGEYLTALEKGKKAKLKFKKPGVINPASKKLTKLGREFLSFFSKE